MFNKHDISRNQCQIFWHQAEKGYDWWWHSFARIHYILPSIPDALSTVSQCPILE